MSAMKQIYMSIFIFTLSLASYGQGLTPIPNNDFETWINFGNYENPQYWDTPNQELSSIPIFGTTVVTKSTDHASGSFSARLESKNITLVGTVPGFLTLGNLTVDIANMTYSITGGAPVYDIPTHLKGYFKFSPKGGDSCVIGIGLTKWVAGSRDTVGIGQFSTKVAFADWTPFSAWINYSNSVQPDTMNIIALSSAEEVPTAGTVLFIDNLYLDYTVGVNEADPSAGIDVYNDRETGRLLLFFDFPQGSTVAANLYDMKGVCIASASPGLVKKGREVMDYQGRPDGIYLLEVIHDNQKFTRKYFLTGR
jgi:hypothetical protein